MIPELPVRILDRRRETKARRYAYPSFRLGPGRSPMVRLSIFLFGLSTANMCTDVPRTLAEWSANVVGFVGPVPEGPAAFRCFLIFGAHIFCSLASFCNHGATTAAIISYETGTFAFRINSSVKYYYLISLTKSNVNIPVRRP